MYGTRVWLSLDCLALAASLGSLRIANASWLLDSPTAGLSPRAYAGGATIALPYVIAFLLFNQAHRR